MNMSKLPKGLYKTSTVDTNNVNNQINNSSLISHKNFNDNVDFNNKNNLENINESNEENNQELTPGDKVDAGQVINENGEVEDSSTKKAVKATGRVLAAYFTGGASIGKDQMITNNKSADKLIGVLSDNIEKVPGVEKMANELGDATDAINNGFDAINAAKSGDINKTIKSGEKAKKSVKKTEDKIKKDILKKILIASLPSILFIGFILIFIIVIVGPSSGGFMGATSTQGNDKNDSTSSNGVTSDSSTWFNDGSLEEIDEALNNIGFNPNGLSIDRINIIRAGVSAFGTKYTYGGEATGPGLSGIPSTGFDCSDYVEWMYWTALGFDDTSLNSTGQMRGVIGSKLIPVSQSEMKPGDIGLNSTQSHTGVYAGNGWWIHTNEESKPARAQQTNQFVYVYRYYKIDDSKVYQADSSDEIKQNKDKNKKGDVA